MEGKERKERKGMKEWGINEKVKEEIMEGWK